MSLSQAVNDKNVPGMDCRLVEAIFIRLCRIHRNPRRKGKDSTSRWTLILHDYGTIWQLLLNNGPIMQSTNLQLAEVNQTTLVQWHNDKIRRQDLSVLLQGINLPAPLPVAAEPLPPASFRPASLKRCVTSMQPEKQLRWLEQNYHPRGRCFLCLKALWDQSRLLQLGSALLLPVCLNQRLCSLCMLSLHPQQTLF